MTIHFYLDSKSKNSTTKAIYCFIRGIKLNKTIYIKTTININPLDWNKNTEKARKSAPNSSEINSYLDNMGNLLQKEILKFMEDPGFDYEELKVYIKGLFTQEENISPENETIKEEKPDFFRVYDEFVRIKSSQVTIGTSKRYTVVRNHLTEFAKVKKTKIEFDTLNLSFFDNFIDFLIKKKNLTNNTIQKYIRILNVFLNWAFERKFFDNLDFKKVKLQSNEPDIVTLTENELNTIYNLDLSHDKRLDKTRDIFCFESFTGQRISDVINFDTNDIKDGIWTLRTKKTKDIIKVPIVQKALKIINKYISDNKPFPTLSNQKLNDNLKEIGALAELDSILTRTRYQGAKRIDEKKEKYHFLTTHVARKTFVTVCLSKGMPTEVVMSITGHKDAKSFKRYVNISDQTKEEEMKKVWND